MGRVTSPPSRPVRGVKPAPSGKTPPKKMAPARSEPGPSAHSLPPTTRSQTATPVLEAAAASAPQTAELPAAPLAAPEAEAPFDIERFAGNLARVIEEGGKAMGAYLRARDPATPDPEKTEEISEVTKTIGAVAEFWLSEPQRAFDMQARLGKSYLDLWASAVRRMAGEPSEPVATPDARDKRFADPEWSSHQFFDFVKQAYLLTTDWATTLVKTAETLDPQTKLKAEFYVRQFANAVAPSNFIVTNPELWRATFSSNAENLVRGMKTLAEDIEAGGGELKLRQSDSTAFEVGRNLAITPGKVIFQNELMQLIQYAPPTETVAKRPLLIVPPWINKFYILDLTAEKSFIRWCVEQGRTVFCISWVNPDERHADKNWPEYMREGPLAALDVIKTATGESDVDTLGYCVGGTLLATTLAYMAKHPDEFAGTRIASMSLLATQVDFANAGELLVFAGDEDQVQFVERRMAGQGYLAGSKMSAVFNLLRSNDLVWPYVIKNYLKGEKVAPFDLLFWNADQTRMPAANHSFYLRNCYKDNCLSRGMMDYHGTTLDLRAIKAPVYSLAAREDHIAPPKSVYLGSSLFGGPVRFVLAGSGHIAGVINPPGRKKYQYWTGGAPQGDDLEAWRAQAAEHQGSWWPDWLTWLKSRGETSVPARTPGGGTLPPIEDAPGSYVRVKS